MGWEATGHQPTLPVPPPANRVAAVTSTPTQPFEQQAAAGQPEACEGVMGVARASVGAVWGAARSPHPSCRAAATACSLGPRLPCLQCGGSLSLPHLCPTLRPLSGQKRPFLVRSTLRPPGPEGWAVARHRGQGGWAKGRGKPALPVLLDILGLLCPGEVPPCLRGSAWLCGLSCCSSSSLVEPLSIQVPPACQLCSSLERAVPSASRHHLLPLLPPADPLGSGQLSAASSWKPSLTATPPGLVCCFCSLCAAPVPSLSVSHSCPDCLPTGAPAPPYGAP